MDEFNFNLQNEQNLNSNKPLLEQGRPKTKKKQIWLLVLIDAIVVIVLSIGLAFFLANPAVQPQLSKILNLFGWQNKSSNPQPISLNTTTTAPKTPAKPKPYLPQTTQEAAVINVVKKASPAVVSIIITKDVPVYEEYFTNPFPEEPGFPQFFDFKIPQYKQKGTKKEEVGGGSGFLISKDGLILTNKHVVYDENAEYTAILNDGEKYDVKVLARDPFQDLALVKIKNPGNKTFPTLKLGDSSQLQVGQTVIAIGNALGEFNNTVSVGVISGLRRSITASGAGLVEHLEDLIQTDAAINRGNSGGPLLNLKGEVIGVNSAMAEMAQSIGFAIPINTAKRDIEQVKKIGKIVYPFLGVRYQIIDAEVQKEKNLPVDYGALLVKGNSDNEPAVVPNSAADKAGLKQGDIILKVDNQKITTDNPLSKIVRNYMPGDKLVLEILRDGKHLFKVVTLGEKTS